MKKLFQHKLSNGLTILGEPNPSSQSCGVAFFVKTGARDESASVSGVSHFLEHMMFKGTKKRSALDITFELGNLGAQANAYTSEEATVYYACVLPEYATSMLELLSDMLRPALDAEEFNVEKKVILEEIALYQDRPQFLLFEQSLKSYFGAHPAGNSVLGSTDSISALTAEQMQGYFSQRYVPDNMALIVTGNFSWDTIIKDAQLHCGNWKSGKAARVTDTYLRRAPEQITFRKSGLHQNHLLLATRGCSAQDQQRYPMTVLGLVLGDGSGSKLYWKVVDAGLAEVCVLDCDERDGAGCILAYAATEAENLEAVKGLMLEVLSSPLDFADSELEGAKRKLANRIVQSGELPMGRLMAIGNDWAYRGQVTPLAEMVERVLAVSKGDISTALSSFPLAGWSEYRLVPE